MIIFEQFIVHRPLQKVLGCRLTDISNLKNFTDLVVDMVWFIL